MRQIKAALSLSGALLLDYMPVRANSQYFILWRPAWRFGTGLAGGGQRFGFPLREAAPLKSKGVLPMAM
jgi:hypothetical protein